MSWSVSIVIATHNRRPTLELTLEALAAQTGAGFRIVVVDDGSTDDTWQWLQERARRQPDLLVLHQPHRGQGSARNLALAHVDGGLVILIGDDILPSPAFVAEHVAAHATAGRPQAVVGFTDWCRSRMLVTPVLEMINLEGHQFGYAHMTPGEEAPFTCFYTSNLSLPRPALGDEPFEQAFTAYGWEDVELGYRLSRAGLPLVYHPAARAEHLHPMTLAEVFARQRLVGRGVHTLLGLHPELAGDERLSPVDPPPWFPVARRVVPLLVPALAALDRTGLPVPVAILHRVLLCGYYLGQAEGPSCRE